MSSRRTVLLFSLSFLALAAPAALCAAPRLDYYLPAGTTYDPRVPTPESHFGFQVGEWHLTSAQIAGYLRAVAAAAPERVQLEVVGHTHERKPLIVLTITAPENHARLEQLRRDHLALLDPAKSGGLDLARMPVVVDLGYSIHGNEPSGVNAMPLFVYHLAAARDAKTEDALRHAIVLIEAQRNPDGGDRAAHWFNTNRSLSAPSPDPADREHTEAWPRGRFNHYLFDPNRDWLPLVHPEARARAELFHRWRPNVLTDHHEMGTDSSFFFQPGVATRNNPSIPGRVVELTHRIAAHHQRALDGRGVFYYSEQGFDDFYPGKGSTYPDLHGTIGILFEQGSARGHAQESDNGLLTFPFAIRNQVLTSFSTLEAALALRTDLLALQRDFPRMTAELAAAGPVKGYVFSDDGDPARAWAFLDLLARHRIEVRPLKEPLTAGGQTFRPGSAWVVPTAQAQFRLLTEIFTRRTTFTDNIFYDVSAWTLPLAYNLPHAEVTAAFAAGDALPGSPAFPAGRLVGGHSDYAYVFDWNGYFAPRALHRLQRAGVLAKGLTGAPVEFVAADGSVARVGPGSVLVPVGLQPEKSALIRQLVETIVREDAVTVYGCATGLTPKGVDLGSASFRPLPIPRVALFTGQGVDPQAVGSAWHVLDQRVGLTPTLLDLSAVARTDIWRYDIIVMTDGAYDAALNDNVVAAMKRWVQDGGTLIVCGRAVRWVAAKGVAAIEVAEPAAADGKSAEPPAARQPYADGPDLEALKRVEGAIFGASIDVTHPLGYGFSADRLALCRATTLVMKRAKSAYDTPILYTASPLLSGYASEANQKAIAESAAAVALPSGRGCVVALVDDVNFRGFWYGGNRVFFNAIFHGDAIRPPTSADGDEDAHTH
ncbi:MAG TPA: M14 family metallopeptidase [Opitutaceae bacterium]|nr:M14 family metallopeptidase [Opitutaceae bacterium]